MTPPNNLGERLEEILRRKVLRPTSEPKKIGNMMIPDGVLEPISVEEAKQAILRAVTECLPEELIDQGIDAAVVGWNSYRLAMLSNLSSEGEK